MGIWQTNTASFKVNLGQLYVGKLKSQGCKFCWIKDNKHATLSTTKDNPDILEVITSDGDTVRGSVVHTVDSWCTGSGQAGWFIISPTQPNKFHRQHNLQQLQIYEIAQAEP